MLIGTFEHNIDPRGRVFIPAKLREELGSCFVITRGTSGCLFGFSFGQWEGVCEKLRQLPLGDPDAQRVVRILSAGATEVELDKQGRALLPQHLRTSAKLSKEATIIGATNRIEIWNRDAWMNYGLDDDLDYEGAIARVGI